MSEAPKREPFSDEALRWRLNVIEARRNHAEGLAWTVPGLAIAGQAFLLLIALNPGTSSLGRLLASGAGLVALLACGHQAAKQVYNFDVYEAVTERDRKWVGLPSTQMDGLTADPDSFPLNTTYVQRRWSDRCLRRHKYVVKLRAVKVWAMALLALLAIDGFLFVYAFVALIRRDDPGWFGEPDG